MSGALKGADTTFSELSGYPSAVAGRCYALGSTMTINVDQRMPFTTECDRGMLSSARIIPQHGCSLLLFPQLRQSVELDMSTLRVHKLGDMVHPELVLVDAKAKQVQAIGANLPPLPTRSPPSALTQPPAIGRAAQR